MKTAIGKRGSVQVIEAALILPAVTGVILLLVYLLLGIFFYVNACSVTQTAADEICEAAENGDIYERLFGNFISAEEDKRLRGKTEALCEAACVLPGTRAVFDYKISRPGTDFSQLCLNSEPVVRTKLSFFFHEKELFSVCASKELFLSSDFTEDVDFYVNLRERRETLRGIYDEIFS